MTRAKQGDKPSPEVLGERFQQTVIDRLARLVSEHGVDPAKIVAMRVRPINGQHEFTVDLGARSEPVILRIPILEFARDYGDLADEYLSELAARVPLRRGRPSGGGSIENDNGLRDALSDMDADRRAVTRAKLAANAYYTEDELRGYLRRTNRTFAELLRDLRAK